MVMQKIVQVAKASETQVKTSSVTPIKAGVAQAMLATLNAKRDIVDASIQKNNRLTGQMTTIQNRLDEIKAKSQADLECDVDQLPVLHQQIMEEVNTRNAKADNIMNKIQASE